MRITVFVTLLPILLLVSAGRVHAQQGPPYRTEEFRTGPEAQITLRSVEGNISVRGTESETVKVELFVKRGLTFTAAGSELDDVRIVIYQRGTAVVATVENRRSGAWQSSGTQYHFVVSVPRRTSSSISTNRGNIEVNGLHGQQDLRVTGGNVRLERSHGEARVSVAGGDIWADRHEGVVFARASGGNIELNAITGETRARTVGGNLTLDGIRGTVIGATSGGNIIADIRSLSVGCDLQAVGGDLTAVIPGLVGSTLNVQGMQVRVNRVRNFEGEIRNNRMAGMLNGGGVPVKLQSSGGTVDLTIRQDRN